MGRGFMNMSSNMWTGWIIPTILLLLIGISVYMIIRNNKEDKSHRNSPALDRLNERYASGEVSEEEYKSIKKNLTSNR